MANRMDWIYDDGGRAEAGFKGDAGDCVTRAFAIAGGEPYRYIYDSLKELAKAERVTKKRGGHRSSVRDGVRKATYRKFAAAHDWTFHPTMVIGSGCTVHLRPDELPSGRIVCVCSGHLCAVINGVIHDTHDPSREGTRCVYGYFTRWEEPA